MTRNVHPDVVARVMRHAEVATWDAGPARLDLGNGQELELKPGVPRTRGECPTQRPCPHVTCRHHLWLENDDGRPWHGPRYVIRPVWQQYKPPRLGLSPSQTEKLYGIRVGSPPSCTLDEVERARAQGRTMTTDEVAQVMGRDPTLMRAELRAALAKVKAAGEDVESFERLLRQEEAHPHPL